MSTPSIYLADEVCKEVTVKEKAATVNWLDTELQGDRQLLQFQHVMKIINFYLAVPVWKATLISVLHGAVISAVGKFCISSAILNTYMVGSDVPGDV